MRRLLAPFAACFLVVACSQSAPSSSPTLSCNFTSSGDCFDYTSGYTVGIAEETCQAQGGSFSSTVACVTTSRVGSCSITDTSTAETYVERYYSPTWNTTRAQSDCASAGVGATFTPN